MKLELKAGAGSLLRALATFQADRDNLRGGSCGETEDPSIPRGLDGHFVEHDLFGIQRPLWRSRAYARAGDAFQTGAIHMLPAGAVTMSLPPRIPIGAEGDPL